MPLTLKVKDTLSGCKCTLVNTS